MAQLHARSCASDYRKPLSLGTAEAMYFEDNEVYIAPFAGTGGKRTGNNPWIADNEDCYVDQQLRRGHGFTTRFRQTGGEIG